MPSEQKAQSFYRWVDERGTVHVVSSLDAVPAEIPPPAPIAT